METNNGLYILKTRGFMELDENLQVEIMAKAMPRISPKTDMIVFKKDAKEHYEDDNRTLIMPLPKGLDKKVYVKLDDFGSKEVLSESAGHKVDTQYAITFLLAEEY